MSIIYHTLEKLEVEANGSPVAPTRTPRLQSHDRGSRVKRLGLFAMLAIAGYGGWLYQNTGLGSLAQIPMGTVLGTHYDSSGSRPSQEPPPPHDADPAPPEPAAAGISEEFAPAGSGSAVVVAEQDESVASVEGEAPLPGGRVTVAADREHVVEARVAQTGPVASPEPAEAVLEMGVVSPGTAPAVLAPQPDDVDRAVEQARNALSRGDFSAALTELVALPQVPEDRADYWLVKGSAHLALGMLEPAEHCLSQAQSLAPGNAQVAVQLAIVRQENDDHAAALQILAEAAEKHTHVPEVFLNMGYSQLALGAEPAARRSFRTFMQLTRNRSLYQQQRTALERWLQQASLAQR